MKKVTVSYEMTRVYGVIDGNFTDETVERTVGFLLDDAAAAQLGGVHDMGMTSIEYAESLNRQYRRLAQRNTNSASLLDASAAPVKASCKARAEVYDLVAKELDGLIALMKEEHSNG